MSIGKQRHNFRTGKVVLKSEIKLSLPSMVHDLLHKFEIICFTEDYVRMRKPNTGGMYQKTYGHE